MAQEDSNFRVYVRCRNTDPLSSDLSKSPYTVNPNEIVHKSNPQKSYKFDRVFDERCDQQVIFKECAEPLIDEFLRGYNGTLFAYGQTGTGKTYTVTGDCVSSSTSNQAGIIPRVLETVFDRLESSNTQDWVLELKYIELYNEELRDLLNVQSPPAHSKNRSSSAHSGTNSKQLRIVENRNNKSIEVVGAVSIPVSNLDSALNIVRNASVRRQTAATQLNSDSSRSHAVLTLILVSREPVSGMAVRSKLHLVDLAGSENVARSGAVRLRAQEAGEINKSLLSLGRVIEMLVSSEQQQQAQLQQQASNSVKGGSDGKVSTISNNNNKTYVSYRESKLTHLLQDSLGGSTKTCMVATISLTSNNTEESKSTLEYASRARSIRNQTQTEVEVMEMQGTLQGLSKRLEEVQQELMMQRNRDGGVYVSNNNYLQLKTNQRKYAELLAQRETTVKHHVLEIDDLRQGNSLLKAERDTLQTELNALKEKDLQYQAVTESNARFKESAEMVKDALSQYTGKVNSVTKSLYGKVEELPDKLKLMREELQDIAGSKSRTIQMKNQIAQGTTNFSKGLRDSLKEDVTTIVMQFDKATQQAASKVVADVHVMLRDVFQDMDGVQEACVQLRRRFDSMQADIAMQHQTSAEMLRLATMLQSHDQRYMETMNQLAKERSLLINDMVAKQEQTAIPRLSSSASNALDLVDTIGNAVSRRPQPVSMDTILSAAYPTDCGNQVSEQLKETVDQNFEEFLANVNALIAESLNSYESRDIIPQRQRLQNATKELDAYIQSLQGQGESDNLALSCLKEKKNDIDDKLRQMQSMAQHSLRNTSSLQASSNTNRSPARSPLRNRHLLRGPTGSPVKSPTRSPVRDIFMNPPRSPLRSLPLSNNISRWDKKTTSKPQNSRISKAPFNTTLKPPVSLATNEPTRPASRFPSSSSRHLPPPKRMRPNNQPN